MIIWMTIILNLWQGKHLTHPKILLIKSMSLIVVIKMRWSRWTKRKMSHCLKMLKFLIGFIRGALHCLRWRLRLILNQILKKTYLKKKFLKKLIIDQPGKVKSRIFPKKISRLSVNKTTKIYCLLTSITIMTNTSKFALNLI